MRMHFLCTDWFYDKVFCYEDLKIENYLCERCFLGNSIGSSICSSLGNSIGNATVNFIGKFSNPTLSALKPADIAVQLCFHKCCS